MNAYEQLRHTDTGEPIAPDPTFAARLRARVTEALRTIGTDVPLAQLPDRKTAMTTLEPTPLPPATTSTSRLVPYACCADASAAIDWYVAVFDAVETARYIADDGRVGHADIAIGDASLMLSDEYPEIGVVSPQTLGGTSLSLHLSVDDVDAVWARAIEHGATAVRPPTDEPYGERTCTFRDPSGHRWIVETTIATPTVEEINAAMRKYTLVVPEAGSLVTTPSSEPAPAAPVELGYFTLGFTDTAMASRFYRELFGWQTEPGSSGAGYAHVNNTELPLGFTPDGVDSPPVLYFRVDDAEAYAARVRDLGGTVVNDATYESGGDVACRDDQGREFHLWQPAPGY